MKQLDSGDLKIVLYHIKTRYQVHRNVIRIQSTFLSKKERMVHQTNNSNITSHGSPQAGSNYNTTKDGNSDYLGTGSCNDGLTAKVNAIMKNKCRLDFQYNKQNILNSTTIEGGEKFHGDMTQYNVSAGISNCSSQSYRDRSFNTTVESSSMGHVMEYASYGDKEAITIKYGSGCLTVIMPDSLGWSQYCRRPEIDGIRMAFTSMEAQQDHSVKINTQPIANAM